MSVVEEQSRMPSYFFKCCIMYAVCRVGLSVFIDSEMMPLLTCFLFQILTQQFKYRHFSVCINMCIVSKSPLKSLNRVLARYPFRMETWTSLDPQNSCLRGPGSLSGRHICSVLTQVWSINRQARTDFSFQVYLWICSVLIIITISSSMFLSHPNHALDSRNEAPICAWQLLALIDEQIILLSLQGEICYYLYTLFLFSTESYRYLMS